VGVEERPPPRKSEKFVTLGNRIVRKNVAMPPDKRVAGAGTVSAAVCADARAAHV